MSRPLFVTGMMRSGTSLAQTLLDNHPDVSVAYQPFHQFLVDVKRLFLRDHGIDTTLPLDNGDPAYGESRREFIAWLSSRRFTYAEASLLFKHATSGKGGGYPELTLPDPPDNEGFFTLHRLLLDALDVATHNPNSRFRGHKEILCEEFLPACADAGIHCVIVLRDPRAVIASAAYGSYRDMVGDRYPVTLMIRLWRKTAAYWLHYRSNPSVLCLRYEDLAAAPAQELERATTWLGLSPFPEQVASGTALRDAAGRQWRGNSSFGHKPGIDNSSIGRWRSLLGQAESRYVAACCHHELSAAGYDVPPDLAAADIVGFTETTDGVRPGYLRTYGLDDGVRRNELARFQLRPGIGSEDPSAVRAHFLFPEAIIGPRGADIEAR